MQPTFRRKPERCSNEGGPEGPGCRGRAGGHWHRFSRDCTQPFHTQRERMDYVLGQTMQFFVFSSIKKKKPLEQEKQISSRVKFKGEMSVPASAH